MTQGGAPHPARGGRQVLWMGPEVSSRPVAAFPLSPPSPFGSVEAISRHFHPSPATSPSPLIHKGARRRLPEHVGDAEVPALHDLVTRALAPRPGRTPTQHERRNPVSRDADGVRQRSR